MDLTGYTVVANLFDPPNWAATNQMITEAQYLKNRFVNSGAFYKSAVLNDLVTRGSTSITIQHWRNIAETDDEVTVEGQRPTIQNITTAPQIAPILNRSKGYGATQLSAAISNTDPLGALANQLANTRLTQQEKTVVLGVLEGVTGKDNAALGSMRLDQYVGTGTPNTALGGNYVDVDNLMDLLGNFGERKQDVLDAGYNWFWDSVVDTSITKQDPRNITYQPISATSPAVKRYKDGIVWVSDRLNYVMAPTGTVVATTTVSAFAALANVTTLTVASATGIVVGQGVAGTGIPAGFGVTVQAISGTTITVTPFVATAGSSGNYTFNTLAAQFNKHVVYCIANQTIAAGYQPQSNSALDKASLTFYISIREGVAELYDRRREIYLVAGTSWNPVGATVTGTGLYNVTTNPTVLQAGGPTNLQLADTANWTLAFSDARLCGLARGEFNG